MMFWVFQMKSHIIDDREINAAEDRKAAIVQGAVVALKKQGLPHISYDIIAREAGVSRQLVRYHFPDPECLMIQVCDHLAGRYRDTLTRTAGSLEGPARVEMFLDFYFDLLDGSPKPRDDEVYDALMSLSAGVPRIREELAGQYGLLGHVLGQEFAVQYPELAGQPAEELSYLFVSLMYGHWKMVASLGFSEDHRLITRRAMDRLIRSYQENRGPRGQKVAVWKRDG